MKKRLIFLAIMVIALMSALAISVSAEDSIIKLDTLPTLEEIHENPSAYVSHLDAFDSSTYKEKDSKSVVVLSDLAEAPTYYVFPSYYILQGTSYYPSVDALNTAVAAADATAFSSYSGTGNRGGNIYIIRIEIPTYVTYLGAFAKFEGSTNLKEVYFPTKIETDSETGEEKEVTCVTTVEGQNTFTSCTSLEVIHNIEKLPLGIWNAGCFSNCKYLKEVKIPQGITSIPDGMFNSCYRLGNVEIPYGVTYIGKEAFANCDAMTEVILPNTVKTINKKSFAYMNNLVTINFGEGLTTLNSTDSNCEIIQDCNNIKYIYIPASFAEKLTVANAEVDYTVGNGILNSGTRVTIFFTGTETEANSLKSKLGSADNSLVQKATFVPYDEAQDYEGYADTLGYTILVYDYNLCEAFYDGIHRIKDSVDCTDSGDCETCKAEDIVKGYEAHVYVESLLYANGYTSTGVYNKRCTNLDTCTIGNIADTETNAIFTINEANGFSTNGRGGLAFGGYQVNIGALDEYNRVNANAPLNFGIVMINPEHLTGNTFLTDGEVNAQKGFVRADMTSTEFSNISLSLSGFGTQEANSLSLVIALYAYTDGGEVEFIQSQTTACANEKVTKNDGTLYTVTYNSVATPAGNVISELTEYKRKETVA